MIGSVSQQNKSFWREGRIFHLSSGVETFMWYSTSHRDLCHTKALSTMQHLSHFSYQGRRIERDSGLTRSLREEWDFFFKNTHCNLLVCSTLKPQYFLHLPWREGDSGKVPFYPSLAKTTVRERLKSDPPASALWGSRQQLACWAHSRLTHNPVVSTKLFLLKSFKEWIHKKVPWQMQVCSKVKNEQGSIRSKQKKLETKIKHYHAS